MTPEQRIAILTELGDELCTELLHDWRFWARHDQLAPEGDWFIWLVQTGRGWGKTRTGSEWVRSIAVDNPDARIALIAPTSADVRDVMVEGESGLLAVGPPEQRPEYEPSKRRLTWPNGAIATTYSADEPNRLRGPQHTHAWCDELAAWRYMRDAWDQLLFGLRLGTDPRVVVTTTPRPVTLLKEVAEGQYGTSHLTRGRTLDNEPNLAPHVVARLIDRYGGTRLGRQELDGELLEDVEGALWTRAMVDATRVQPADVPELVRIIIPVDPAVSSGEDSSLTGVVPCAVGVDRHLYVLEDLSSRYTPTEWAQVVVDAFDAHDADRVVGEVNNGGDLVEANVRNMRPQIPFEQVRATRGKVRRAEPVAALWEQGRAHIVGSLPDLEDQMCAMVPGEEPDPSPDRADAMVWGGTQLLPQIRGAKKMTLD